MALLAVLTCTTLYLAPQGTEAPKAPPLLSAGEQKSLHDKLGRLISALNAYESTEGEKAREKAAKVYDSAKDAFHKEWDARIEKKGDLLGSVADLRAVFGNCFEYEKRSPASIRKIENKDVPAHFLSVGKSYKSEVPTRTILLVPGQDDKGWVAGQAWFEACWDKAAAVADSIFHIPVVGSDIDMTTAPDYTRTGAEEDETRRIQTLLLSFGETQRAYNIDRSRLFLDTGKGAGPFALRFATHFPHRFAGLILRHPDADAVANLRLGSLNGMPVLLLSSAETAAACKALRERIDAQAKDSCTVIETTDTYPFKAAAVEIEKWMSGIRRDVNRKRVVLEPNDDRFCAGYWVGITTMDSIVTAPADKKPRIEVEADRANNRIVVKAVGIESFELRLNDLLVDLNKEFTVVINDKAITEKRSRVFTRTFDYVRQRFDSEFLFPVQFTAQVPKQDAKPADAGGVK